MEPVFIVGSPRSGTTWLQLLLAQFDAVATAQETHLFSRYLGPVLSRWDESLEEATGLHTVLGEDTFVACCRQFAVATLEAILQSKPGATIAVEKTPGHVFHIASISTLLPEARFLHILRDPRAVASSLLRVSEEWGTGWAPTHARDAARLWERHVEAGRRAGAELGSAYREVRYEELCSDPVESLRGLATWSGVETDVKQCVRAVRSCSFDRINTEGARRAGTDEIRVRPGGDADSRTSRVGAWRDEMAEIDVAAVEREVSDVMDELGYERMTESAPLRLALRDVLGSTLDTVGSLPGIVRSWVEGR